ncbi:MULTISPECIES: anti-phage dCTP deaminase [Yersinia]|uniref:anti-phage dCTP deaminase n=1 Tax=Yersinia TaxID=629 RepID=UPI001BAF1B68|nr:anti-phage dCTP deaminase [Yersinia sp. Marseille-Q3913]EKN5091264.1 deoxycytidylate deaminase [Yersinia enterocolitica]EKN5937744.1 deoxycytidylate deaminase [Yersinia enterocolitica]EKN6367949.1 deoxycytidylate deaminase [Yersinia enterocolitica]ELI8154636.1 deoxycytidylate deaminase [Yersinia enterocolitica]ELI8171344.1 deoxycytidylate deaminase [Yersinia enterocolitica]
MADSAENIIPVVWEKKENTDSINDIKGRRSQELIIGLCGAIGSGIKTLKEQTIVCLQQNGYHVEHIRISDLISTFSKVNTSTLNNFDRYKTLQDLGDNLREQHKNFICAELAILRIQELREEVYGKDSPELTKNTKKTAYIIDQIKHPSEVELFTQVYKNNFYLVGLLRTVAERIQNLKDESIREDNIQTIIERDRKSSHKYGQQVEETLQLADYFIKNLDTEVMKKSVQRFIDLIHSASNITPSKDESGMYSAYSASLGSACLSRQVGASIMDVSGNIIATGRNDVPQFGGGLYTSESVKDRRCFNKNGCHNDKHKALLKNEIKSILQKFKLQDPDQVAEAIMKETKAKYLIEYSRAVHAEMDAIVSLARNTNMGTTGNTLYCTTYPCHVCARHIVAAGLRRVVYIEPYEKSLALQLHDDTICQSDQTPSPDKVLFENFEGVAPKRYAKFFGFNRKRKDAQGKPITYRIENSFHVDTQYLDSYGDYESKVISNLKTKLDL